MRPIDDGQTSIFDGERAGNDHLADTRGSRPLSPR